MKAVIALMLSLAAAAAFDWPVIERLELRDGSVYEHVKIMRFEKASVEVIHLRGRANLELLLLPPELLQKWGIDEAGLRRRLAEETAAERQRAEAKARAIAEAEARARLLASGRGVLRVGMRVYQVVQVRDETPAMIEIEHEGGFAKIKLEEMSPEDQAHFGYEAELARRWPLLSSDEQAREKVAWLERRRLKRAAEATGRE